MGSKHFRVVYDLERADADAAIRCNACHHVGRLSAMKAVIALGARTSLIDAGKRLRCTKCGERGASIAAIPRL